MAENPVANLLVVVAALRIVARKKQINQIVGRIATLIADLVAATDIQLVVFKLS